MKKIILIIILCFCTFLHADKVLTFSFKWFITPEIVQTEILDFQDDLKNLSIMRSEFSSDAVYLFLSGSFPKLESLTLDLESRGTEQIEISGETFAPNLKHLALGSYFYSYPTSYALLSWGGRLSFINSFKTLESLSLTRDSIYDQLPQAALDSLTSLPMLKKLGLHLDFTQLDFRHFTHLEALDLSYSRVRVALENLPNVKNLNLNHIQGDWGMDFRDLAELDALSILNLSGVNLTPEQIEQTQLATMHSLDKWVLEGSKARGIQFSTFSPNLKSLSLKDSNVTGGDIAQVSQLNHLEFLDLSSTAVTGVSIKKLAVLTQLKELILTKTNMSKADFSHLPASLETLDLAESQLSISSFNSLSSLVYLKRLNLHAIQNTNITQELILQLQDTLPGTEILF